MNYFSILKKSLFYLKPFRKVILFFIVLSSVITIATSLSPLFIGKFIDGLIEVDADKIKLFALLIILSEIVFRISQFLWSYFYGEKWNRKFDRFFSLDVLEKSLDLSLGQLRKLHSGYRQTIIGNANEAFLFLFRLLVVVVLDVVIILLVAFISLFFISIKFFYLMLVFFFFSLFWQILSNLLLRPKLEKSTELNKTQDKFYVDILRNLFFIKFSGQNKYVKDKTDYIFTEAINYDLNMWKNYYKFTLVDSLFFSVLIIFIILYFITQGVFAGVLTIGIIYPIFTWFDSINRAIRLIIDNITDINQNIIYLKDFFELIEEKPDTPIILNPKNISSFKEKITFENVSFDYTDGKKQALKNSSFEIKKGEKVAIIGKSGSGKSTLVSLMLRIFDPTSGSVKIDGINLKDLDPKEYHKLISYVPQDCDLVDFSVKENILLGSKDEEVSDESLKICVEKSGVSEFVKDLPNGLDSIVGERGVKLSGGQKQRVCIARALISKSPILILDEATSSLDSETEGHIKKSFREHSKGNTEIIIAHRLNTVIDAEKIIFVRDGEIDGIGKHNELLQENQYYKRLIEAQEYFY